MTVTVSQIINNQTKLNARSSPLFNVLVYFFLVKYKIKTHEDTHTILTSDLGIWTLYGTTYQFLYQV